MAAVSRVCPAFESAAAAIVRRCWRTRSSGKNAEPLYPPASTNATGVSPNYHFLDFTGGTKPHLLVQINNHMGAVTGIQYKSSTQFFTEDQESPATRWKTPLPFPVQVVALVEVLDQFSQGKLTTEYGWFRKPVYRNFLSGLTASGNDPPGDVGPGTTTVAIGAKSPLSLS